MARITLLRALFAAMTAVVIALIVTACGSSVTTTGQQQINHVFVITLENKNYATTFGANSKAPYLSQTLARRARWCSSTTARATSASTTTSR